MSETESYVEPEKSSESAAEGVVFSVSEDSNHACGDRWAEGPSRWCAVCS